MAEQTDHPATDRIGNAIRGSIAKWEAIVAGTGEDGGLRDCPLCQIFNPIGIDPRPLNGRRCLGCPVAERTGETGCNGSPYEAYSDDNTEENAQAELDFLRSILVEHEAKAEGRS